MRRTLIITLVLLAALTACQQTLDTRVADDPNEVMTGDPVTRGVLASNITVFGIGLGDTEQDVLDLHGEPRTVKEYKFGRVKNMEYAFVPDSNKTSVLYHLELGLVRGILVTNHSAPILEEENLLGAEEEDVFSVLGTPTVLDPLSRQTLLLYDDYGYEVFVRKGLVDRIFFTTPFRGVDAPGERVQFNESCPPEPTPAQDPESGACYEFPNPCLVPEGWSSVETCEDTSQEDSENRPPQICIQVIAPAVNPVSGECVEYSTPCDVPADWEPVDAC